MRVAIGLPTLVVALTAASVALACQPNQPGKLKSGRTITIDASAGVAHGSVSYGETGLLRDKEVLLTFDDGPVAGRTTAVLDALEDHCVKATFFPVGRMAIVRPNILRETLRRGHTIGGHTWSHPNLRRVGPSRGRNDIQKGFAALEAIIGPRVSPVFRFPYLAESQSLLTYLKSKDIASISIDVDSRDTRRGYRKRRVIEAALSGIRRRGRGILLFHDSKRATALALPEVLDRLARDGFRVVHLKTETSFRADPDLVARYRRRLDGAPVERSVGPVAARPRRSAPTRRRTQATRRPIAQRQRAQRPRARRQTQSRPRRRRQTTDWRRSIFSIQ
ncbi:MAG: polysaccharide deacetylase family protein [Pseudomonadota bacterium]